MSILFSLFLEKNSQSFEKVLNRPQGLEMQVNKFIQGKYLYLGALRNNGILVLEIGPNFYSASYPGIIGFDPWETHDSDLNLPPGAETLAAQRSNAFRAIASNESLFSAISEIGGVTESKILTDGLSDQLLEFLAEIAEKSSDYTPQARDTLTLLMLRIEEALAEK